MRFWNDHTSSTRSNQHNGCYISSVCSYLLLALPAWNRFFRCDRLCGVNIHNLTFCDCNEDCAAHCIQCCIAYNIIYVYSHLWCPISCSKQQQLLLLQQSSLLRVCIIIVVVVVVRRLGLSFVVIACVSSTSWPFGAIHTSHTHNLHARPLPSTPLAAYSAHDSTRSLQNAVLVCW